MMNLRGQPELTKGWSSVIIMIWIKACFSYLYPQCCSWTKSCYCWKRSDLNCTPNGSSCAFCVKRGHLENKVNVYDQRNDCNLMTIVAHEWYISPQYLTKLFKNFKYLKINTIDLQGPAWNFLKNTSLSQPVSFICLKKTWWSHWWILECLGKVTSFIN